MSPPERSSPSPATRRAAPQSDLGIVDALVQSSFRVQQLLGDVAAEHDLSVTQLRLLGVLRDREPRMAQLAQLLGLSKQSATGLIDRAERRGILRRIVIPVDDGRAVHVTLTDEGQRLVRTLLPQISRQVTAFAEDISPADRTRLSSLLTHLIVRDAQRRGTDLDPDQARIP